MATTLAYDIGGTGLKATVLDPAGEMLAAGVRVPTTYPMPPATLVDALVALAAELPAYDRVSAGFPGVVRHGLVRSAPHFVTTAGPGTAIDPELAAAWDRFDLAGALSERLGRATKVVNDADLQGAAVVSGDGLELVLTLGTGLGSAVYVDGRLGTHLELAHHPSGKARPTTSRSAMLRSSASARSSGTNASCRRSPPCARCCCPTTSTSAAATPRTSPPISAPT
jgi:polyphosphate glucokinase